MDEFREEEEPKKFFQEVEAFEEEEESAYFQEQEIKLKQNEFLDIYSQYLKSHNDLSKSILKEK